MDCRRISLLTAFFYLLPSSFSLQPQRPAERTRALLAVHRIDPRTRQFVAACLGTARLPVPVQLYAQQSWFIADDLAAHIKDWRGADDDGTAQVWQLQGVPRAVSQWVHDDEFDRHTLACLDPQGNVKRLINEYMPGMSEPELHWIYIHTVNGVSPAPSRLDTRYTSWDGRGIAPPMLTSEDRDFIAGERLYRHWKDFDFAASFERSPQ